MRLSVILPIFNEEAGIKDTIVTIESKLNKLLKDYEILAVNDGSIDNTLDILKQLQKTVKNLKILNHPKNLGYGAALRTGVNNAKNDWVFFTDADMQFDVAELKYFLPKTDKYDFVVGYRKNRADPLRRKITSGVYNRTIRMMFGLKLKDVDCAFKLMKKTAVQNTHTNSNSFFISVELMVKAYKKHFQIYEIGVSHFPRIRGKSTVTLKQIVNSVIDLMKLYKSLI